MSDRKRPLETEDDSYGRTHGPRMDVTDAQWLVLSLVVVVCCLW